MNEHTERVKRIINFASGAMGFQSVDVKWFFSFSTLLYFIRDKNIGLPMWGDFDISVIEEVDGMKLKESFESVGFIKKHMIVNDITKEPFQMTFSHKRREADGIDVDVYLWFEANGYLWHTCDAILEHPMNGIPSEYIFKGTLKEKFDGDLRMYRWEEACTRIPLPNKYGTLLDAWYPGWYIADSQFGQSKTDKIVTLKTCENLKENLK